MTNADSTRLPEDPVRITIPLEPRTKKNSQRLITTNNRYIPIPSKPYKEYEKASEMYLDPWKGLKISDPVNVQACYYMGKRRAVDLTNLNEAIHDILVKYGVLADDNCRIVVSTDGSRVMYDRENPRTEILITKVDGTFPDTTSKKEKKPNVSRL